MKHEEKATLRKSMRAMSPPETRREEGLRAAELVKAWPLFQQAQTVGCYWGMPWEIDTKPVLRAILDAGKELALPRTYGKGIMEFCRVEHLAFLRAGRWNIPEPGEGAKVLAPESLSLLLVPALAVDACGRRLGQGAGYYDRYLPNTRCPAAALVLARQVVHAVPCGERDYLVQWIITGQAIAPAQPCAQA